MTRGNHHAGIMVFEVDFVWWNLVRTGQNLFLSWDLVIWWDLHHFTSLEIILHHLVGNKIYIYIILWYIHTSYIHLKCLKWSMDLHDTSWICLPQNVIHPSSIYQIPSFSLSDLHQGSPGHLFCRSAIRRWQNQEIQGIGCWFMPFCLIENDGKNWVGTRVLPCFTMFYHVLPWFTMRSCGLSLQWLRMMEQKRHPASSMLCNKSLGGSLSHWKATNQSRWVQIKKSVPPHGSLNVPIEHHPTIRFH